MLTRMTATLAFSLIVSATLAAYAIRTDFVKEGMPTGINWYGVLQDGLAEAKRTGKPILLTSAAPQCIGVSGMW
ncbi:MAG: hypothetical protein GY819_01405 [Planctomycetaceae bacterium]|nr:hypothetical protein [Planctomycetaceae bacterium]MDG1807929.1 hypothetical protein [Pirellulaceae bacterium]MDG2103990.1 hypothetical protein [Pirellulaceae bacterium]